MRKLVFAFALILMANIGFSQVADHAIGLRLNSGDGYGTEISYQYGISNLNRMEFDLGVHSDTQYNSWGLAGIYQWVWNIDGGFNWYAGFGGRIGSLNWDKNYDDDDGLFLSAVGDIGIEYAFPVGIQLSLDARPEFGLINRGDSYSSNIALSIRYQF